MTYRGTDGDAAVRSYHQYGSSGRRGKLHRELTRLCWPSGRISPGLETPVRELLAAEEQPWWRLVGSAGEVPRVC
jgi:hypothetical protein